MPVYVAESYDSKPISVVVAKSKELANAYWQGQGVIPHSVREITHTALENHPTGVLPIVNTREMSGFDISNFSKDKKYFVITK